MKFKLLTLAILLHIHSINFCSSQENNTNIELTKLEIHAISILTQTAAQLPVTNSHPQNNLKDQKVNSSSIKQNSSTLPLPSQLHQEDSKNRPLTPEKEIWDEINLND
ncbi:MAG: hypothetical protein JO129_04415 [Candidatus Dependentiae bacterium]|nr:hypothetical protein [Candidatus Dependentiae bacterium]